MLRSRDSAQSSDMAARTLARFTGRAGCSAVHTQGQPPEGQTTMTEQPDGTMTLIEKPTIQLTPVQLKVATELPLAEFLVWSAVSRHKDHYDPKSGEIKTLGSIQKSVLNLVTILEMDTRWEGRIRYNQLKMCVEVDRLALNDTTEIKVQCFLNEAYGIELGFDKVHAAMLLVGRDHEYHPVRDYLDEVRGSWDGEERIKTWLSELLGADDTEINRAIGRCFLISMVARAYAELPRGVKVDTSLILVGAQGTGKSTALAELAGREFFSDSPVDLGGDGRRAMMQIQGVWLYEFAELDAVSAKDVTTVKAFISGQIDKLVPPYGRNKEEFARQVVFAGTTNNEAGGFLKDSTGSRRFWPVTTGEIDLEGLRGIRDQLWAEAVDMHSSGAQWWLNAIESALLRESNEGYEVEVKWVREIDEWSNRPTDKVYEASIYEILTKAIGIEPAQHQGYHTGHVATALRKLGWAQDSRRNAGQGRYERLWTRAR